MMWIKKKILDAIIGHAQREAPIEACGYLSGMCDLATNFYPMTNIDNSPEHFSLDPKEQFAVLKKAREKGEKLIAVYHSHPASPAWPSQEDIRIAYDPDVSHVIISLAGGRPAVNSYKIRGGEVFKEKLEVLND